MGISKGRKCYDLVNASYLWLVDRTYYAFTSSEHLRPFEIQAPVLLTDGVLLGKYDIINENK